MSPRLLILLEYDTCIVTTETEGVAEGSTNGTLLSLVEGEIERIVNLWIFVTSLVVDGWRYNVILDSEYADHRLNSTSGTQQVTRHGLC